MPSARKPSEMSLDELVAEKRQLDANFFATKNLVASLTVAVIGVAGALYAMQDGFSLILTGIIIYLVGSVWQKFAYRARILREIAARRSG